MQHQEQYGDIIERQECDIYLKETKGREYDSGVKRIGSERVSNE